MRFNTAIAAMMEFVNGVYKWDSRPRAALVPFVLLLAPYAPHVAEELWERLGGSSGGGGGSSAGSLTYESWPQHDEALLVVDTVNLPVQVGLGIGVVERCVGWFALSLADTPPQNDKGNPTSQACTTHLTLPQPCQQPTPLIPPPRARSTARCAAPWR
jgi:hypothetical protein